MNRLLALICCLAVSVSVGCRFHQLRHDQVQFRHQLQQMYTDQVMNNLVRAKLGLPFVQLDYTDITGTVTHDASASYGGSQTLTADRSLALPAMTASTLRRFSNFFEYGFGGSQRNQLTVTANPVIDNNAIYSAYLSFITRPDRLIASPEPPPCEAVHIMQPCGDMYYWVPIEYKDEFLRLALETTVLREEGTLVTVSRYFKTTIVGVTDTFTPDPNPKNQHRLTLRLKDKIPNDTGQVVDVVVKGKLYSFQLQPYYGSDDKPVDVGDDTNLIELIYSEDRVPVTPDALSEELADQEVSIELHSYRPKVPSTEKIFKAIERENRLQRLDIQGQR